VLGPRKKIIRQPCWSFGSFSALPNNDLCGLVKRFGFEERTRGSHRVFRKEGIEEKINLQRDDDKAKPYQVRQVRALILKYKLGDKL
jgi:predicted RNA binding protein YcfA (HicA-like mRNA interferase family)